MLKRFGELGRRLRSTRVALGVSTCTVAAAGLCLLLAAGQTVSLVLGLAILAGAGMMLAWTLFVDRAARHGARGSQAADQAAMRAEQHYVNVLRQIVHIVEGRDQYTKGHSQRVGALAERIARRMNLPPRQCELLNLAGQLHDIGLLAVPAQVLGKQGGFGAGDYRTVQRHSEVSYELLKPLELLGDVLAAIRHHHERLNGTGYPDGLSGEDIPLEARILAVADSYEAMTHDRPHRPAMTPFQAMQELSRCTPSGYDPHCVEAMAQIVHLPELQEILSPPQAIPAQA